MTFKRVSIDYVEEEPGMMAGVTSVGSWKEHASEAVDRQQGDLRDCVALLSSGEKYDSLIKHR